MAGKKNFINATIWADDGCKFEVRGPFPKEVNFAVYMLLCRGTSLGDGSTDSRAIKRFVGAMKAYLKRLETE